MNLNNWIHKPFLKDHFVSQREILWRKVNQEQMACPKPTKTKTHFMTVYPVLVFRDGFELDRSWYNSGPTHS